MNSRRKPVITCLDDGPYLITGLDAVLDSDGEPIASQSDKPNIALCRCGGSATKPFCDGAHKQLGFSSKNTADGRLNRRRSFAGKKITIHDNRAMCAHVAHCVNKLPSVFQLNSRPWVDPNGADVEYIIRAVKQCPSGALSYSIDDVEYEGEDGDPAIMVAKDGPYVVTGSAELKNVDMGEGVSGQHYTLCRCGASKNKPFCDGAHHDVGFKANR
jgi:CDGSH-type Zn-finger protein